MEKLGKFRFRVKGISWWEQELPNKEEMAHGLETLEKNDWKCDFVLTHAAPSSVKAQLREKHLKRHLSKDGVGADFEMFQNLMELQVADAKAHVRLPFVQERIDICTAWAGEYGREVYGRLGEEGKNV